MKWNCVCLGASGSVDAARVKLSSDEINAVKGFFILCIILGHNNAVTSLVPGLSRGLYSFHVSGFLLLPFLFCVKNVSCDLVVDRFVRYYVPYVIFYVLSSILFFMFVSKLGFVDWLVSLVVGGFLGSSRALDESCGFQLYWFLPTLFSLVVSRYIFSCFGSLFRLSLIVVFLCGHFSVGSFGDPVKYYTPFGLLIVLYVFPLGLIVSSICHRIVSRSRVFWGMFFLVMWLSCLLFILIIGSRINVGTVSLYSYSDIWLLLLHDLNILFSFFSVVLLSFLLVRVPGLVFLGKYSLLVYLTHSLLYHGFLWLVRALGFVSSGSVDNVGFLLATIVVTVAGSLSISVAIDSNAALRQMITPRSRRDWPPTASFGKVAARSV